MWKAGGRQLAFHHIIFGGDGLKEKRTLCESCKRDYGTAGFYVFRDGFQVIKSSCDLCGRPGYDYVIKKIAKKGAE